MKSVDMNAQSEKVRRMLREKVLAGFSVKVVPQPDTPGQFWEFQRALPSGELQRAFASIEGEPLKLGDMLSLKAQQPTITPTTH